jgi:3-deoxy-7-phosphoheptulonate synthase
MIIVMAPGHSDEEFQAVLDRIEALGYRSHVIYGVERKVIGCVGHEDKTPLAALEQMPGVENAIPILKPFKLASAEWKREPTVIHVGDIEIGGPALAVIAGPGIVESEAQIEATAKAVKAAGAQLLRGCVHSHHVTPYGEPSFDYDKLQMLLAARDKVGIGIVTEVFSGADVEAVGEAADVIQIGARSCQNFYLLRQVGRLGKPVFLKRGMSTTIREFVMAAEYILSEGNGDVILCERGIRTFGSETPFTLDLNAIPVIKRQSHLPVFIDPSHGTGKRRLVAPLAKAAVAAGCDGLMIEVHPTPEEALMDGAQSLNPSEFETLMDDLRQLAPAVDRTL